MKKRAKREKKTYGDRIFLFYNNAFLLIFFLLVLYPLIYIVSSSFSSTRAVSTGKVWLLPVEPSLVGYKAVFENDSILLGYANTIFYTSTGTAISIFMTICAAYPLSRKDFFGRNFFMFLFTFTMIFNGGLIPTYLLVRSLGMVNTRWVMLILPAMGIWHVIVTRTYYQHRISQELLDASRIDGCSDIQFIIRIVIPISGAITAVMVLFYAVGHWNAFFNAFIYLNRKELFPLQIILRNILILNEIDSEMLDPKLVVAREGLRDLLKYSLIIVSSVPVLLMYPFVQKHFVKGIMLGSIKG